MSSDPQQVQSIFGEAVQKPKSERVEFLGRACGGDSDLRGRVEALIQAHEHSGSFLDSPPKDLAGTSPTVVQSAPEQAGSLIGPYKLLQQIGEGGMGSVFMAEQIEPVERRVALKIIKPGMDTKAVIARFEAERQALAMMDHHNIAKVLDVGTTNSGRPYFVMELVRGVPITQYCDEHQLTPRQRLELFLPVCQAVQHAHQKGIIHRDIKPSNVLVAEYDDRPVPKIIDFGLAKAMEKRLTAKTMFTEFGQIVGTPDYMSPEQAKLNHLDIDTRSDIYSLGVLLYELLSGNTPFDRQRMRSAAFDELLRIIREEEPPKPSQRLSTVETLPSIAANRHITPAELTRQLSGELDWIVMKTLEKDRARRYDTANGLANELRRYLNDEPVEACPPSAAYRFRKFARRNKTPLAMATAVTLALVIVAIGSTIAASRFSSLAKRNADLVIVATNAEAQAISAQQDAEAARDREQHLKVEAQRQTKIATDALFDLRQQRERAEANFVLARSAVDEFLNHVTKNELLTVPGMQSLRQQLLSSAMEFYDKFTRDDENTRELLVELASAHYRIAVIRGELGQKEESSISNAKSIELFEKLRDGGNESLDVQLGLAKSFFRAKRYDDTESICREILDANARHAATRSLLANTYNSLAIGNDEVVEIATALKYHQQSLALREGLASEFPDSPDYLAELGSTLNNLGVLLARQNRNRESLAMFLRGVSYSAEAYELAPQSISWGRWLSTGLRNVAVKQASFGERDAALRSYQKYVAVRRKLAFENPAVPSLKGELHQAHMDLASYQRELNLTAEADRSLKAAQDVLENIPRNTPTEMFDLAIVYGALSLPTESSAESSSADEIERRRYADLAMETIAQAVQDGYRNVNTLKSHKYLDALRERDDYKSLVSRLAKAVEADNLVANEAKTDLQKLANHRESANLLRELAGDDSTDMRHRETLASTLHSIGEIQLGLRQYNEAEKTLLESLEIRKRLQEEAHGDPQAAIDVLTLQNSLGSLEWAKRNYADAHQQWKQVLSQSLRLAETHRDVTLVQERLSAEERRIAGHYGSIGLWPLVEEWMQRNVEFGRGNQGIDSGEFSAAILASGNRELAKSYYRKCVESLPSENIEWYRVIDLARGIATVGDITLLSDELKERALSVFEEYGENSWVAVAMAVIHYKHGEFSKAKSILDTLDHDDTSQVAFLGSAIARKLGDTSAADDRWLAADEKYQTHCQAALHRDVTDQDKGVFNRHWWQFAYGQAMRRLALEAMLEEDSAVDRWQHLIQARGYRLIGETAKVKSELAVVAASEDAKFWAQFAPIVGDWEEASFTVEEAWQRAFQLAGDDPVALIEYAQWHDECDRQSEAEDAFRRAEQLDAEAGRVWVAMGRWHQEHARDSEAQSAYLSALNLNLADADKIQCTDFLLERVSQIGQQQRQEALNVFQTITNNGLLFNKVTEDRAQILSEICVRLSFDGTTMKSKNIPQEAISAGKASVECRRRLVVRNSDDTNLRALLAGDLLMLAQADHSNQGQYHNEAEQILDALIQKSKATGGTQRDYAKVYRVFGELRTQQRRLGDSRQLLQKAVAIDPTNAWHHAQLGKAYLATTPQIAPEVRGGVRHLIRADDLSPENLWIRRQLNRAVNRLEEIVDGADSPNVEDTYLLAVGLARCGRLAEALSYFRNGEESFAATDQVVSESLVELREDARQIVSSENVLAQARTFREQREVNRAMELLNALLDDELHVEALRERALCHAMGGDELSAINDAKSARHLEPTPQPFVDVLEKTANELAATREWISAAILFRWLYDETQQSKYYAYVAYCDLQLENSERYREHCRYALEHFGTPDSNIGDKRWVASMCNFIPNAVDDTNVIVTLAQDVANSTWEAGTWNSKVLGWSWFRDGQVEKAIPLLEKIAAADNDMFRFNNQFILAMAYHETGKAGLASECLEKGDAELASYIQFRQESWIGLNGMVLQKEAHELLGISLRNLESDAPAQSP